MGLFDIFNFKKTNKQTTAPTMSGAAPFYTDFGSNIYASDIIVQSIRCKANEFKKLKPRHIRTTDGKQVVITDSPVAKILARPNEMMTTSEFLEKITILLELNKNVFIYTPYYRTKGGEKVHTAAYPLKPSFVEYLADESGKLSLHMVFANGYETTLPKDMVIHWRKDYGVNDYFGGGMCGGNDDAGLLAMLDTYDKLLQSLSKALECSCQINGIVQRSTYSSTEELDAERVKFENALKKNESGILFTDLKATYTHIPRDIKIVDADTLKAVYEMILRANGTSLPILNGDYNKQQKEAYYEHALEGDIIGLGQAASVVLFSERETSFGNEVVLYPNDILFMSMENKISYMQLAVPAGALTKNEIRAFGGLPPVENGDELPRAYNSLDNNKSTEGVGDE